MAWVGEQRRLRTLSETAVSPSVVSCQDTVWGGLTMLGTPSLWPDAMKALWLGEPVWDHLQKQSGWFQVVEAAVLDVTAEQVVARVIRPSCCLHAKGIALEALLLSSMQASGQGKAMPAPCSDDPVTVLVGRRSRLAVRVLGYSPESLREALQAVCEEVDTLLDEPMISTESRLRLIKDLLQRSLFRSGPKAAPWTLASATRFLCLLAVAAGVIGYVAVEEEVAWQKAIARLDAEPGIRVTGSEIRWGARHIEGLRDATSAEPAVVLRSQGRALDHVVLDLDTAVYREAAHEDSKPLLPFAP